MTEPGASSNNVLFISHHAADRPYAEALQQAIHELVDSKTLIKVTFSTGDLGPEGGEQWRDWIYRQVVEARTALVVVTPHALGKPWLLWEAGACWGAGLAQKARRGDAADPTRTAEPKAGAGRLIISIAYGLPNAECPDPLRGEQIVQGNDADLMGRQFMRILEAHAISSDVIWGAGRRTNDVLRRYLASVEAAMKRAPSLVNEANVQDWLARLDTLARADRLSELAGFERWMMLAFGRDTEEDARSGGIPIDVRLHRRLGELHLGQRQYPEAVRQLHLAWRAAPRDIFVLRPLAEASMKNLLASGADSANASIREEVRMLLEAISELDDRAYTASTEAAGLLAKYYRRVLGEPEKALDVYRKGLEANPDSYYLTDLVAQTELELGLDDAARANFHRALDIIERLDESNIWSHATAATACVGLADLDRARQYLMRLRAMKVPTESEVETIARGIREVGERTGVAPESLDALLEAFDPRRDDSGR